MCGQLDFERMEVRRLLKNAWDAGRRRLESAIAQEIDALKQECDRLQQQVFVADNELQAKEDLRLTNIADLMAQRDALKAENEVLRRNNKKLDEIGTTASARQGKIIEKLEAQLTDVQAKLVAETKAYHDMAKKVDRVRQELGLENGGLREQLAEAQKKLDQADAWCSENGREDLIRRTKQAEAEVKRLQNLLALPAACHADGCEHLKKAEAEPQAAPSDHDQRQIRKAFALAQAKIIEQNALGAELSERDEMLRALIREVKRLSAAGEREAALYRALKSAEWQPGVTGCGVDDYGRWCSACDADEQDGHTPDCTTGKALALKENPNAL